MNIKSITKSLEPKVNQIMKDVSNDSDYSIMFKEEIKNQMVVEHHVRRFAQYINPVLRGLA